ncbi:twin-arginine translocase TatA/TatE family subunit [Naumannella halotolerans]|uniref:Sec-independent protein translocase protein TatA n=1 Tax=Naumannella halotolerans TaxID=993414 RepID=A0A4R7J7C9_9ACTN|nr:twin-arginine translocase TatA/TatE family subunit [Naumannella halotolerans]TDT33125.1 sec-independent protein translocase protein TatA [Naumannella halotolerans]
MAPLIGTPSVWTLLIILALALLLFGGTRLAGLGKSTGKAIREFKEETRGLGNEGSGQTVSAPVEPGRTTEAGPVDAELVDPPKNPNNDR